MIKVFFKKLTNRIIRSFDLLSWKCLQWYRRKPPENSIAICTVFILRENILFLEEWIEHHVNMGIDHFFLYDNSRVQSKTGHEVRFELLAPRRVNKFGINYNSLVNEDEAKTLLEGIQKKYPERITVLPWQRKNTDGTVGYFQIEAVRDFIKKARHHFQYALHIDIDEFMISKKNHSLKDISFYMTKNGITSFFIKQKFFENRFSTIDPSTLNPHKQVREITKCLNGARNHGEKTLFNLGSCPLKNANVHFIYTLGKNIFCNEDMLVDHHYRFHFQPGDYDYDRLKLDTGEDFITEDREALKYL